MSETPYIGLRPFKQTESDIFFGREKHTDKLLDTISEQHFTAVIGLSGCGKSSLINAGLIPGIQMGLLPQAGVFWRIITTRPGDDPFGNLAKALLDKDAIKDEYEALFKGEDFKPDEIQNFLENSLLTDYNLQETFNGLDIKPKNTNFLLIVDQFEEIFKFREQKNNDENQEFTNLTLANKFVNFLLQTNEEPSNIYILISMRAEFIGECAKFYHLAEKISETLFILPHLTRAQLKEAIEKPIQIYGGSIDENLVCKILNDAANEPDQLPLIQHLLLGMWNKIYDDKKGDTVEHYSVEIEGEAAFDLYKRYGGLQKSLFEHIDKVYERLENEKDKLITEYLFKNLVKVDDTLPNTRRSAKLEDIFKRVKPIIKKRLNQEITIGDVIRVTEQFRKKGRRFIEPRIEDEELTQETKVYVTHESLIRQWDRLQDWKETEEYFFRLYRSLKEAFERWNEEKNDDNLLKGAILAQAEEWIEREQPTKIWAKRFSKKAVDFDKLITFIEESRAKIEEESRAKIEKELHHRTELFQQQAVSLKENARNKKRIAWLSVILSFVLGILFIIGSWFFFELDETHQKLEITQFDSNIALSVSQIQNNQFTLSNMALNENNALLNEKVKIPIFKRHINRLMQGYIQQFSQIQADKTFTDFESEIYSLLPVNDGFIVSGKLGKWGMLDTNKQLFTPYPKLDSNIYAVAAYNNWLVTGDKDGKIIVWDENQQIVSEFKIINFVTALANVDNTVIVADSKGFLHYGEITKQGLYQLSSISAHSGQISGLNLNQNKTKLLTTSYDKTAKLWKLDDKPTEIATFKGDSKIYKAVFNVDDTLIATANADNSISLFDNQAQKISSFRKHQNSVFALQFSKDNRYLISGSQDNDIIVWDVESHKPLKTLESHEATVSQLILDNQTLWSSSIDGQIKHWTIDLPPYRLLETCRQQTCPIQFNPLDIDKPYRKHPLSVAISPQGKYAIVGFMDGTLRLYDLATMQIKQEVSAHKERIRNIKFNDNGNFIATASYDKKIDIFELTENDLQYKYIFEAEEDVYNIAFAPNGKKLAAATMDGKISIYQFDQSMPEHTFPLFEKYALYIDFLDDNRLLVTGDSQAYILNSDSGHTVKLDEAKEANDMFGIIYSNTSGYFASYGQEGKLNIFDGNKQLVKSFVAHQGTIYKAQFSPDGYQVATIASDGTLKMWDVEADIERLLFSIDLPIPTTPLSRGVSSPVYDFDFRCTTTGCWIVIPMLHGRIVTYHFGKEIYKND